MYVYVHSPFIYLGASTSLYKKVFRNFLFGSEDFIVKNLSISEMVNHKQLTILFGVGQFISKIFTL